jgi:hypothetical protein
VAGGSGGLKAAALLETMTEAASKGRLGYLLPLTLEVFPELGAVDAMADLATV